MPPGLDDVQILRDWNTATAFLEGAEVAYEALLEARWRPEGQPLHPLIREATSKEVRAHLDEARRGEAFPPACSAAARAEAAEVGDGSAGNDTGVKVASMATRFERLHGPPSLDMIRNMDMSSLMAMRQDHAKLQAFHDDTWKGSTLWFRVASVAELELFPVPELPERRPMTLRRADRLHFKCDFNLREGIASPILVEQLEVLLEDQRPGPQGFRDEDFSGDVE